MANYIQIIQIHPILIIRLHLAILKTKFLPLVIISVVQKWNYLILAQIHGQRKLHFLTALHSELIFGLCFGYLRDTSFQHIWLWSYQS